MSKVVKIFQDWLPEVWAMLVIIVITGGLVGAVIAVINWILTLLGVM